MLEKGNSYFGKVLSIVENYDKFAGNAGMTYCHKVTILVGNEEVIAQVCEPTGKLTDFKINESINFTVTGNGKSMPTIKKITVQELNNPPVAGSAASVALMAAVNLYQYQPLEDKGPELVLAAADSFHSWLKIKQNGK